MINLHESMGLQNIKENGEFAPKEQMLLFPLYFHKYDILKATKGVIME